MGWGARALIVLVVGCGSGPSGSHASPTASAAATTSPSPGATSGPSPSPTSNVRLPLGVIVKDFIIDGGATYSISLVGLDGHVAATAVGHKRSQPGGGRGPLPTT